MLYGFLGLSSILAWRFRSKASPDLQQQVNAWWLIFPVVTAALLLFPLGICLLFLLLMGLIGRELSIHARHKKRFGIIALSSLTIYGMFGFILAENIPWPWLFQSQLLLFGLSCAVFIPLVLCQQEVIACWWLSLCGLGLLFTAPVSGYSADFTFKVIFLLFVLTALNDVAQFIIGKLLGRHRIAPKISPHKTWQGLIGGILITMILAILLGRYFHLADHDWLLASGLGLSLCGFVGDLSLSLVKRQLTIKDFSRLIRGHGGILDRVDSLIFTTPAWLGMVHFFPVGQL